jgi:hypothetical protein
MKYGAEPAIADRRQKSAKAGTIVMAGCGDSHIFINYHDVTEAELASSVLQRVLPTIDFREGQDGSCACHASTTRSVAEFERGGTSGSV